MDVKRITAQLHLSTRVHTKAEELFRLANVCVTYCLHILLNRLQLRSSRRSVCLPAVCVALAATACTEPLDKTNEAVCVRLSGVTKKIYEESLLTTRKLLDLEPTVGCDILCTWLTLQAWYPVPSGALWLYRGG